MGFKDDIEGLAHVDDGLDEEGAIEIGAEADTKIVELTAQNEALKNAVKEARKVFINLLVVVKQAGMVMNEITSAVLSMDDDLKGLRKRFDFTKETEAGEKNGD